MRRIVTSPALTWARHVPHTPPLQANGRSERTFCAASSTGSVRGSVSDARAPVENDRHRGAGAVVDDVVLAAVHLGRGFVDVEELAVHLRAGHAEPGEHLARVLDHAQRAAEPPVRDLADGDERADQRAQAVGVETAVEQVRGGGLAREHVHELQAGPVAVLEVGEVLAEHHGVRAAVAVEQGDVGVGVRGEHRRGDREHRRDPGAGGDEDVVVTGAPSTGGEKRPCGGPTSISSPAVSRSTSQVENSPVSTRRTPIRGAAPSGAQIE